MRPSLMSQGCQSIQNRNYPGTYGCAQPKPLGILFSPERAFVAGDSHGHRRTSGRYVLYLLLQVQRRSEASRFHYVVLNPVRLNGVFHPFKR